MTSVRTRMLRGVSRTTLLCVMLLVSCPAFAVKNVLVLHSYHQGFDWTDNVHKGMLDILRNAPVNLDVHIEYLDTKMHPPEESFGYLADFMRAKYKNMTIDVILLSDNNALNFILPLREKLFPHTPIVFCGINNYSDALLQGQSAITGVVESIDVKGTMALAHRILPTVTHYVAVTDLTKTGQDNAQLFRDAILAFEKEATFELLDDLSAKELRDRLRTLPDNAVVLAFTFHRDSKRQWFSIPEYLKLIVDSSNRPIFSFWDHYMPYGILGGNMVYGVAQGEHAASMAVRLLQGLSIDSLPIRRTSPNVPIFNFEQMQRFNISSSALPNGSVILNRPVTIYEEYKVQVWTGAAVLSLLLFSTLLMALNIIRRRNVERALRKSREQYRGIVESALAGIWQVDGQGITIYVNRRMAAMLGHVEEEMIGVSPLDFMHPSDLQAAGELFGKSAEDPVEHHEFRFRHKNGLDVWTSISSTPVLDDTGKLESAIAMVLDISESRKNREALRVSEDRFRNTFEQVAVGMAHVGLDGTWLRVNRRLCDIMGYSREEFLDLTFQDLTYPEDLDPDIPLIKALLKRMGPSNALEKRYIRKDGSIVWAHMTVTMVMTSMETPDYLICVIQDVTNRKLAEKALRESEERFRSLYASMNEGACLHELVYDDNAFPVDYRILEVNPQFEKTLSLRREDVTGHLASQVYGSTPPPFLDIYADVAETGTQKRFEEYFPPMRKHFQISAYSPAMGKFATIFQDITERKNAEEKLRETTRRLQVAQKVAQVGDWAWDPESDIITWSEEMYSILGLEHDQGPRNYENNLNLYHPEDQDRLDSAVTRALRDGTPYELELRRTRPDGREIIVLARGKARRDPLGGITGLYGSLQDITERKKTEQILIQAKNDSESANKSKSEFLANMSHEIRTPLNGIMGMLHLMKSTDLTQEQLEFVDNAIQSSKRLTTLLSDILDLSRIEAGMLNIAQDSFDFQDTMDSLSQLFTPAAQQKNLSLRFHISPDIPEYLVGDVTRLQQILSNLIGNSIKFTNKGGIDVHVQPLTCELPNRARILFSVEDTGIGIPEEKIENLFGAFTQAESSYRRKFQGAGLGLAITRQLVTLLGGEICTDSEPDKGTTMLFSLPLQLANEPSKRTNDRDLDTDSLHLKVLLAEDDEVTQFATVKMLEKMGHSTLAVGNGEQALAALRDQSFDLVLMDVQMPVMDGVEASIAIRRGYAGNSTVRIPIVAMTAYAMVGDKDKFLAAGMNDYIAKPVEMDTLHQVIVRVANVEPGNGGRP